MNIFLTIKKILENWKKFFENGDFWGNEKFRKKL